MNERIERIETQLDNHSLHLSKIQMTIDQVKWMAAGMILTWILTEFGVLASLKMVM